MQIRQKRSRPFVDEFFSFFDAESESVLDAPPAAGIRYSRDRKKACRDSGEDGRLPIHTIYVSGLPLTATR